MRNILLDTHAFTGFVNGDPMLGKAAKGAIENLPNKALMMEVRKGLSPEEKN